LLNFKSTLVNESAIWFQLPVRAWYYSYKRSSLVMAGSNSISTILLGQKSMSIMLVWHWK
jgi:hypothetical protein